jgi:hypothetical protein
VVSKENLASFQNNLPPKVNINALLNLFGNANKPQINQPKEENQQITHNNILNGNYLPLNRSQINEQNSANDKTS